MNDESIDHERIEMVGPHKRDDGRTYYSGCRIPMVYEAGRGFLNLATGETSEFTYRNKLGVCGVPLFSDDHIEQGICRNCASKGRSPEKVYHIFDGDAVETTMAEVERLCAIPEWKGNG